MENSPPLELEYLAHFAPLIGVCRETLAKNVRRRQVTPTAVVGPRREPLFSRDDRERIMGELRKVEL